jgi:hypothetical protein
MAWRRISVEKITERDLTRFLAHIKIDEKPGLFGLACWRWTAHSVMIAGVNYVARRVAFALWGRELGPDERLIQLCRTPSCILPEHMRAENMEGCKCPRCDYHHPNHTRNPHRPPRQYVFESRN